MAQKKRGPGRPKGSKNKKTKTTTYSNKNKPRMKDLKPAKEKKESTINSKVKDEICGIIFFAIGAFFIVALFTSGSGQLGGAVSDVVKGLFGSIAYFLPFYFVLIGVLLFIGKTVHLNLKSILLMLGVLICIATLNSSSFISDNTLFNAKLFYTNGVELKSGGLLGMMFAFVFNKVFGKIGLWIITIALMIIFILLFINTPLSQFAEKRRLNKKLNKEKKKLEAMEQIAENDKADKKEKDSAQIHMYDENFLKTIEEQNKQDEVKVDTTEEKEEKKTEKKSKTESGLSDSDFNRSTIYKDYKFPSINLLNKGTSKATTQNASTINAKVAALEETLRNFNVNAHVVNVTQGPTVTRYEIQPETGVKVSRIVSLADDIALNLKAKSIRVEAPIPGKAAVGIEIENDDTNIVMLRDIIDTPEFHESQSKISFGLGKDISGKPIISDLKKMPHLLIAGATGSGKSVCINTIITSILYRALPDEVKLILIDPKVVELGNYNGIPHLLIPVVTDSSKAAAALNWAVAEMTSRYKKFAEVGVKNITSYNEKVETMEQKDDDEEDKLEKMPEIVIVIDELADLMLAARKQVEDSICRLAQLARAAGMHLVVATQRPSVNVVTGVIKANIPARIAFAVSSYHDSQTIMDTGGAESLVGNGDMLYMPSGSNSSRVQGAFISEDEVNKVIKFVTKQCGEAEYSEQIIEQIESPSGIEISQGDEEDELMNDAIDHVLNSGQASVSMLQRRFRIGYNRAARIIDDMEARGIVGPPDGARPRQVLISKEEYYSAPADEEE